MRNQRMARPRELGYDTPRIDVLHGMSTPKRWATVAALGLAASLVLPACGTVAGTATRDAETSTVATTTKPKAPVPTLVPTQTTTAPVPSTQPAPPSDPLTARVQKILFDIDTFWEQTMGLGKGSVGFTVREFDSRTGNVPTCGGEPYDVAGYCELGDEDELQWDRAAFADKQAQGGEMAMALTLAHEYGHALQDFEGRFHGNRFVEVQADCLSGVYMSMNLDKYGTMDDLVRRALPTSPIGQKPAREKAFKEGFTSDPNKLEHCLSYQG